MFMMRISYVWHFGEKNCLKQICVEFFFLNFHLYLQYYHFHIGTEQHEKEKILITVH